MKQDMNNKEDKEFVMPNGFVITRMLVQEVDRINLN